MKVIFPIAALFLSVLWQSAAAAQNPDTVPPIARRPNILIITADNLGYGDLPCFNPHSRILAPNLDQLGSEGVRLTDFYTASPTCTVSRACLLTGRVADRHGLKNQLPGIEGNYGRGLRHQEVLIPQVLKTVGCATGCFGKWNIGFATGSRPTERGFDEFIGHASGNIDYYRFQRAASRRWRDLLGRWHTGRGNGPLAWLYPAGDCFGSPLTRSSGGMISPRRGSTR